MAGLGAVRGMFGAVLLCSILALVFILIGLLVPEWGTSQFANDTDVNKKFDRVYKIGLFSVTTPVVVAGTGLIPIPTITLGKCATDECRDAFTADESVAETSCKQTMRISTKKADHAECSYHKKGYCRCPYPEDNWTLEGDNSPIKATAAVPCTVGPLIKEDKKSDTVGDYYKKMNSCLRTAVIMLILSIVLVFLAIVLAIIGSITAKWILGIVGAIFLCLALIFAIVGLIMGTGYVSLQNLSGNCGSQDAWDEINDKKTEHAKMSFNNFGAGPILVLVGILFLFVACILDCMVSGLAKKIHKVADIDGDGRIG